MTESAKFSDKLRQTMKKAALVGLKSVD